MDDLQELSETDPSPKGVLYELESQSTAMDDVTKETIATLKHEDKSKRDKLVETRSKAEEDLDKMEQANQEDQDELLRLESLKQDVLIRQLNIDER